MTWSVSRSFLQRMTVCHVFVSLGYFLIFATWAPIVGLLAEEKIVEVPQTVIQTVDRHVPKIEIQEIATWTYYHYSLVLLWIDCLLVLWWIVFIQLLHGKLPLVFFGFIPLRFPVSSYNVALVFFPHMFACPPSSSNFSQCFLRCFKKSKVLSGRERDS